MFHLPTQYLVALVRRQNESARVETQMNKKPFTSPITWPRSCVIWQKVRGMGTIVHTHPT